MGGGIRLLNVGCETPGRFEGWSLKGQRPQWNSDMWLQPQNGCHNMATGGGRATAYLQSFGEDPCVVLAAATKGMFLEIWQVFFSPQGADWGGIPGGVRHS